MQRDDGGPAYPHDGRNNGPGNIKVKPHDGMTLRDWFAGHALPAIIRAFVEGDMRPQIGETNTQAVARETWAAADAMIAERSK